MSPTGYATDILMKCLLADTDQILQLINDVAEPMVHDEFWKASDVKRLQKQALEVVRIRNHLAVMLDHTAVADPRQFDLFGDMKPGDFE